MAVRKRALARLSGYALLLGASLAGCRAITVCSSDACREQELQVGGADSGGAAPRAGSSNEAGAGNGNGADAAGGATVAGAAGDTGDAGAAPDVPPVTSCEGTLRDCDGASLTGCETDVTSNVRHCAGCDLECDGICGGAECESATTITSLYPRRMVASGNTGFAFVHDGRGEFSILKLDLKTASAEAYLSVPSDTQLVASGDRVYFASRRRDPETDEVETQLRSAQLDGSGLILEENARFREVGATAAGFYYVDKETDDESFEDTFRLHYRPSSSSIWQVLHSGNRCEILATSSYGMVVGKDDEDGNTELFLIDGAKQTSLGPPPENLEEIAVTRDDVVALTYDWELGISRLSWLGLNAARSEYEIPSPSNDAPELNVLKDGVVLFFQEHGVAYIREFNRTGPTTPRLGIAPFSHVVYVDPELVWYAMYDNVITTRFLRTRWFQLQ